jgi:hypothetical protein
MKRTLTFFAVLVAAFALFVPGVYAGPPPGCTPDGTLSDDTIVCNADDADGVNTGAGTDSVTITAGTVLDTIRAEGVQVTVVVNGTGALDTSVADSSAIWMPNGGAVIFEGSMTSGFYGILVDGDGSVNSTGDITASEYMAIVIMGDGSVVSSGDILAAYNGIFVDGDGSINNSGSVTLDSDTTPYGVYEYLNSGLVLTGSGTVDNSGNVNVTYSNSYVGGVGSFGASGILVGEGGTINNSGDISIHYDGIGGGIGYGYSSAITLMGGGTVNNSGTLSADGMGIVAADYNGYTIGTPTITNNPIVINNSGDITAMYGIFTYSFGTGGQTITNSGDIHLTDNTYGIGYSYGAGIYVLNFMGLLGGAGNVSIDNSGDIDGSGMGIYLSSGGSIVNSGTLTLDSGSYMSYGYGLYMEGTGTIDSQGVITTDMVGIGGGSGEQSVDVSANVSAPMAVSLGGGNDSLTVRSFIVIDGDIMMGDGDDIVWLANNAVVNGTIYGGETGEVNGDLLVIGVGEVCASEFNGEGGVFGLDDLDPEMGSTTYLGQTYTWAEFEALGHEGTVSPCLGKIEDGRINAYDLGAPEALYCTVENGISVWELDLEGNGTFSFAVNKAQIDAAFAAAVASGVNTLIGSDSFGNELYALSDGTTITFVSPELRESGKTYMTSFERTLCG